MDFKQLLTDNPKELDLFGKNIGDDRIKILATALSQSKDVLLEILILSFNKIGDEGMKCLSTFLVHNNSLKVLSLVCNNFGDEGISAIASILIHNTSLKELDLRYNKIGDTLSQMSSQSEYDQIKILATALENNYSLTELWVDNESEEINNLLERNKKYQKEIRPKVKNLLLLARTFDEDSPFFEIPLDIFKIFYKSF